MEEANVGFQKSIHENLVGLNLPGTQEANRGLGIKGLPQPSKYTGRLLQSGIEPNWSLYIAHFVHFS